MKVNQLIPLKTFSELLFLSPLPSRSELFCLWFVHAKAAMVISYPLRRPLASIDFSWQVKRTPAFLSGPWWSVQDPVSLIRLWSCSYEASPAILVLDSPLSDMACFVSWNHSWLYILYLSSISWLYILYLSSISTSSIFPQSQLEMLQITSKQHGPKHLTNKLSCTLQRLQHTLCPWDTPRQFSFHQLRNILPPSNLVLPS